MKRAWQMLFIAVLLCSSFRPAQATPDSDQAFIVAGNIWKYFKGLSEPDANWRAIEFDDSAWLFGPSGIGYGSAYSAYNKTVLTDMEGKYRSVYLRRSFNIIDPLALQKIWLHIDYDDGFVAYLNGKEVTRRNMGAFHAPAPYNMDAKGYKDAGNFESIDITDHLSSLVAGKNVLSIQVHNANIYSSDLSLTAELYGSKQPGDVADTLLLYDPNASQAADNNFRKLSGYYGLKYYAYDLADHPLTAADLRDARGNFYQAIGISEAALAWLDGEELALLKQAVDQGGANLFIYDLSQAASPGVAGLTDGEVTGSFQPSDNSLDFVITQLAPDISKEFSGQSLSGLSSYDAVDYGLTFSASPVHTQPIIQAWDDAANIYNIFAVYQNGAGKVFVQGQNNRLALAESVYPMKTLYTPRYLTEITPLMMFIRYAAGDEAWHRDLDSANLTIDDPYLTCDDEPGECHWEKIYWQQLLAHMQMHNFHTTIAFVPARYQISEAEVVNLVKANPDYYSLAFHGNNHDCPEFSPSIPVADQEADIVEARSRMRQLEQSTGIPYSQTMIFPCGGFATDTLDLLKKYNFNLTINGTDLPIGATGSTAWDRGMSLADLEYGNFGLVLRHNTDDYTPGSSLYIFDLFRDKPALLYSHASAGYSSVFTTTIAGFDPYADAINGLNGKVDWQDLDELALSFYLEKKNDDGSLDVRMFGNHIQVKNPAGQSQVYHVRRVETLSYPLHVLVDGVPGTYRVSEGEVLVDLTIPAGASQDVLFAYNTGLTFIPASGQIGVTEGGAVATYQVRLEAQPQSDIMVTLAPGAQVTVSPSALIFTPDNWNIPQTVTVTAVDDLLSEARPHKAVIQHTLSSTSLFYNHIQDDLVVLVMDNEPMQIYFPFLHQGKNGSWPK